MKIDVRTIVVDHWSSLIKGQSTTHSVGDFVLFYGIPLAVGIWSYERDFKLSTDGYNVSVTFFGIFIALLLNIQVAIFAIFQRKWKLPETIIDQTSQSRTENLRTKLLSQLNANISYLVLVCCVVLVAAVWFYVQKSISGISPAIISGFYVHFLLTLLMVIKRSHALFQFEYSQN